MSATDEPRTTEYWKTALILARTVINDSGLLAQADADRLAEAVTERLLGDFQYGVFCTCKRDPNAEAEEVEAA